MLKVALVVFVITTGQAAATDLSGTRVGTWQRGSIVEHVCLSLEGSASTPQGNFAYHEDRRYVELSQPQIVCPSTYGL
jgi:hypothetical protein